LKGCAHKNAHMTQTLTAHTVSYTIWQKTKLGKLFH